MAEGENEKGPEVQAVAEMPDKLVSNVSKDLLEALPQSPKTKKKVFEKRLD